MSSSSAKARAKSPAPTSSPSTTGDAYRLGHTASVISPSTSRAATLIGTSPLPKDILPASPGYFSEKQDHEDEAKDYIVEIPDSPPEDISHNPLTLFHAALGIPPPKPVKPPKPTKKNPHPEPPPPRQNVTPANKGIYHRVLQMERTSRFKYHLCDSIVTLAMFLQIIVGAAVTAFGAGSASHIIITVFGAANTALASLLAVLKSQGLPNRIRQDWNSWRELREFVEEKEREIEMKMRFSKRLGNGEGEGEFGTVDAREVWDLVKVIEGRYEAVRLTCEANRPDTYIPVPRK